MLYCPHCMNPASGEICPTCGGSTHWQAPSSQLPVGTLLRSETGHVYQIGAAKGQGGFGITYAALDMRTNSRVAIKEYYPSRCASRDSLTRVIWATGQQDAYHSGLRSFLEEARMLSTVGALPSVVSVRDFFESNGTAYIVMEYVDGTPLHEVVRRQGRMSRAELFAILPPLLRDLGILHRAGVIHRDISPDNLILTTEGKLKLLDFGSARSVESGKAMTVMLKAGFSPIEQYQSKGQGPFTDIYALAGTIYYCLTGVVPPTAIDRIGTDELRAPNDYGAGLTQQEQDALLWGMSIHAQARPQNMEAFANALLGSQASGAQSYPQSGHPQSGYPQSGYPQPGYPQSSQPQPGYPQSSQPQSGYPQSNGQGGKKGGFGKGLFIGLGAAAAAVVILVAVLLLTGVFGGSKSTPKVKDDDDDVYVRSEERVTVPVHISETQPPAPQPTEGASTTSDGFVYRIVDGEAVIVGYVGEDVFVCFPDELEGCTVTILDEGCLAGNTTVQSVLLPIDCIEIRANAFAGCTDLRDISCYSTITVDPSALDGCVSLRALKRMSEDSVASWSLPESCKVYVSGMDTGVGGLTTMDVDDQGVVYGITDADQAAILDIPSSVTYLEVPEDLYGYPVTWVWEGAMEDSSSSLTVLMCPDMGFDLSLLGKAEWDFGDMDDFCYNWYFTCILCDDINASISGRQVVPDRLTIEAAMIRAQELEQYYDFNTRPDGTGTADLLDGMGIDWTKGRIWDGTVDASTDESLNQELTQAFEDIEAEFSGTYEDGVYFDAIGAAIWQSAPRETIYIYAIGIVR